MPAAARSICRDRPQAAPGPAGPSEPGPSSASCPTAAGDEPRTSTRPGPGRPDGVIADTPAFGDLGARTLPHTSGGTGSVHLRAGHRRNRASPQASQRPRLPPGSSIEATDHGARRPDNGSLCADHDRMSIRNRPDATHSPTDPRPDRAGPYNLAQHPLSPPRSSTTPRMPQRPVVPPP